MNSKFKQDIEGIVTFLPTESGGRKSPAFQEYRPQFYYNGSDWVAVQQYPDVAQAAPGETVRVIFSFLSPDAHWGEIQIDKIFLIREGTRTIGYGKVTKILDLEKSALAAQKRKDDKQSS